jgi:hypothetical protein
MLKESIKSPIFTDVAPEKLYYFDREQPNVRLAICPSRTSERGGEGDCVKEGIVVSGKLCGNYWCTLVQSARVR